MPVKLVPVSKTSPREGSKGEKKYYAAVKTSGTDTIKEISHRIEKMSTASGADIRAVMFAFVDVMKDSLSQGRIVRLPDLGSFRISISSTATDDPSLIGPRNVKEARVVFQADKDLKVWTEELKFIKE
jgi:predicted histone-like DNA-binding protein